MTQANYVDAFGLHLEALTDIVTNLETKFKAIYGADINLDPESEDKQTIELFAQAKSDMLDTIRQVYNSFSPSNAIGTVLDNRLAINAIQRLGASYTRTEVTVTTDRTVTLPGIDTAPNAPYTVKDEAGTKFYLESTQTLTGASAHAGLVFRAAEPGRVATTIGTINSAVTITLGVTAINNPNSALITGQDEETDPQARQRREASVSISSDGYLAGLIGALKAVPSVLDANVYENTGSTTDTNGVPGHSIWCVIDCPTSSHTAIADAIYRKRSEGCGMRGVVSIPVLQVNGTYFNVLFDKATTTNLYMQFYYQSSLVGHTVDTTYLANMIAANISYKINEAADWGSIIAYIKELDPYCAIASGGVSNSAGSYTGWKAPGAITDRWAVSTGRISFISY